METLPLDTVQKDCILFQNRYYDAAVTPEAEELGSPNQNRQPTAVDCCRSCHTEEGCNVWQWCYDTKGCTIRGFDFSFPYQGCQLLRVRGFSPYAQGNLTVITGPSVTFTAGGATDISVPAVDGFDLIVGADFGGDFDYECPQSVLQGSCMIEGTLEEVAAECKADSKCKAFVFFPEGIDFMGPATGVLKTNGDIDSPSRSNTVLNPSGAVYLRSTVDPDTEGSSGGGGGGSSSSNSTNQSAIIAGSVAGSVGLVLLAAAALLYFKGMRPRRQAAACEPPKPPEGDDRAFLGSGGAVAGSSQSDSGDSGAEAQAGAAAVAAAALVGGDAVVNGVGRKDQGVVWDAPGNGSMKRSHSPPSVVDATMAGVLGDSPPELAGLVSPAEAFQPQPPQQQQQPSPEASPFCMYDAATIAAMQAAAPGVVELGPVPPRGPKPGGSVATGISSGIGGGSWGSGTPSGMPQLRGTHTSSGSTAVTGASSLPHQHLPPQQYAQQLWPQPGLSPGWGEGEVVVAQLPSTHGVSAISRGATPPSSAVQGSTARELLETFAKLYRQRPTPDYSALEGVLEVDAVRGGSKGGGSISTSPELTLEADTPAGRAVPAGRSGPSLQDSGEVAQVAERAGRAHQGAAAAEGDPPAMQHRPASGGLGSGGVSSGSIVLPEMPWSDWALQPEEVEVCRRPDGSWWQLGSGACGTVYKGLFHGVQPVAVKVLHQREDDRRSDVFMREVTMLKGLRDRNIVQFLGASLDGASAMLVTEFMELGDLWRALPIRNSNGERVFCWSRRGHRVALDVARGLHYLHHKRVVHLDLKSANILLSRHGTAKICDIGMARVLNRDYLTVLSGLGTFAWSAPEVLAGRRCTEKVDIYSFGVVLWEICTGEVPVRGDMRPLALPEDCPQEVVDLHAACTAEDPADRPTALQIVELLSGLQP